MPEVVDEITLSQRNLDDFWERVNVGKPDECWEWKKSRTDFGYGRYKCRDTRRVVRAHRFSYQATTGKQIPQGLFVLHSCDNPPCVNPRHLSLGTKSENSRQAVARGRQHPVWTMNAGSRNGGAKLSMNDAREIRHLREGGESVALLAKRFGVSPSAVTRVIGRVTWKEV